MNVQKAFQSCVNTHFTPGAPVQAQEVVDGYVLCRCFCKEPDQGWVKEDTLLRRPASLSFTAAVSENQQQPKFQWLQCAMSNMNKSAHCPIILN